MKLARKLGFEVTIYSDGDVLVSEGAREMAKRFMVDRLEIRVSVLEAENARLEADNAVLKVRLTELESKFAAALEKLGYAVEYRAGYIVVDKDGKTE